MYRSAIKKARVPVQIDGHYQNNFRMHLKRNHTNVRYLITSKPNHISSIPFSTVTSLTCSLISRLAGGGETEFGHVPWLDSVPCLLRLRREEALSDKVARTFGVCHCLAHLLSLILIKEAPIQITPADHRYNWYCRKTRRKLVLTCG